MKTLLLSSALALTLTGCVVSGHPSTDTHHSHVDTSATRYDEYDPNYAYSDDTQPRSKRRVYEDFKNNDDDDDDDYYETSPKYHDSHGEYVYYRGQKYYRHY